MGELRALRPHQDRAISELRTALGTGSKRVMLSLPTGAGKTVIAANIVSGALAKGRRVTFVVPSIGLIDQTFERFTENGIDPLAMGVIQADHPWRRAHAPVQIASVQTLARRQLPLTDLVISDEAHVRYKVLDDWMDDNPTLPFVGLSATPWSRGLGKRYQKMIKPILARDLIEQGYLSRFKVFAPSHPDLTNVRTKQTVNGLDYHEGDINDVMNKPTLVADIVQTWIAKGNNQPTLCFAVSRAHAQAIHDQFAEVGIPVAYVDANTPRGERTRIGVGLETGQVKVVCNIGTLTTGIDWDVRCLILARPTKSEQLFVQIIGRALRTAKGKDFATILDHSDTHLRLGMVTDIDEMHDELCDGTRRAKSKRDNEASEPLPRECVCCSCLIPARQRECPACGHAPAPRVGVDNVDGSLEELTGSSGKREKVRTIREVVQALGKQKVFSQLLWIKNDRRRSDGWVSHAYRELFDVWPRGLDKQAEYPDWAVFEHIRAKDRAYAKSRNVEAKKAEAADGAVAL